MVELMPAGTPGPEDSDVATLQLRFREPGSNEIVSDTVTVSYPYATDELRPTGFFQGDDIAAVQKNFVMMNIFVGLENAVTTFASGLATEETVQSLDALIAAVEDYNEEVGETDITADLTLLRSLRRNLVENGVPESREAPANDPWPAD